MSPRDRLAAILVLVYGQQIEKVAVLTWEGITVTDGIVSIDLAGFPIRLDSPLDQPVRDLIAAPLHCQTAAHPNSPWVFRGAKPGRHLDPAHLRARLKPTFSILEARLGTLHELTRIAPVAIRRATTSHLACRQSQQQVSQEHGPRCSQTDRVQHCHHTPRLFWQSHDGPHLDPNDVPPRTVQRPKLRHTSSIEVVDSSITVHTGHLLGLMGYDDDAAQADGRVGV